MIPNKFVIFWNNQPVGIDEGYPFRTDNPTLIKYWNSKELAENYISLFARSPSYEFTDVIVHEIQFRIVNK